MPTYIDDGFNLKGYIAAAPQSDSGERLWDAVEFEYRPATRAELVRMDSQVRVAGDKAYSDPETGEKLDKIAADFVASHLKSWNIVDSNKNPVPISPLTLQRIHEVIYQRLVLIIRGVDTSDKRPDADKTDPTDEEQLGN